ncbi:MAG: hypothetical protein H6739_04020 [Alphaproteobacteria bacterium]|nr:hypothetical protein [Alphaproteobacteria bacterium]
MSRTGTSEEPPRAPWLGWLAACALAVGWGLGPALPALLRGELIGQPFTDLYPAVWGMWWFAGEQPGLPTSCALLGAPAGMPFYYSSPLHGWAAWPLLPLLGLPATWNALVVAARVATVLCAYGAARAWGLARSGALVAAAVYGCAPFFHGYAVEGIVEGTDGWTLALWLWAFAARRPVAGAVAFALTVLSSWYLAAVACVLAVFLGPRGWLTMAGGLALSFPALWGFLGAFPGREPLDPAIRAAMGTQLGLSPPGLLEGLNPFAKTSWVGLVAPLLALRAVKAELRAHRVALAALAVCVVLSFGVGFWYGLPPLSALRFPYRFHAGTLAVLALLAGRGVAGWRFGGALSIVIVAEGLALSPVEPVLPGAPAAVDPIYAHARKDGLLLDIPGPVAMPPGQVNASRPRARWFLYGQTAHGRPSPWVPDFNSVGVVPSPTLDSARALDPLEGLPAPEHLALPPEVRQVVVHRRELRDRAQLAHDLLLEAGFVLDAKEDGRWLYLRP